MCLQSYSLLEFHKTMSMTSFCTKMGMLGANITFHVEITNYD